MLKEDEGLPKCENCEKTLRRLMGIPSLRGLPTIQAHPTNHLPKELGGDWEGGKLKPKKLYFGDNM